MGLAQLNKLESIGIRRRENYRLLNEVFKKYEEFFHLPKATEKSDPSWFAYPLTLKDGAPFRRSDLTNHLENCKIQTRTYFAGNIALQPAYSHLMETKDAINNFPVSTKITRDTFFLGTSPVVTEDQIKYIDKVVDDFLENR
jgi:CDP-6-deoxy-D-xylo-4-hexulose-3-dehydrase